MSDTTVPALVSPGAMVAWARMQAATKRRHAVEAEALAEFMFRYCLMIPAIIDAASKKWPCVKGSKHALRLLPKRAEEDGIPDVQLECVNGRCDGVVIELKIDATLTSGQRKQKYFAGLHNLIICPSYRTGEVDRILTVHKIQGVQVMTWRALGGELDVNEVNRHLLNTAAEYGEHAADAFEPVPGNADSLLDPGVLCYLRSDPALAVVDEVAKAAMGKTFAKQVSPGADLGFREPNLCSSKGKSFRLFYEPCQDRLAEQWPFWIGYGPPLGHYPSARYRLPFPYASDRSCYLPCLDLEAHVTEVTKWWKELDEGAQAKQAGRLAEAIGGLQLMVDRARELKLANSGEIARSKGELETLHRNKHAPGAEAADSDNPGLAAIRELSEVFMSITAALPERYWSTAKPGPERSKEAFTLIWKVFDVAHRTLDQLSHGEAVIRRPEMSLEPFRLEYGFCRASEETRWVSIEVSAQAEDGGQKAKVLLSVQDGHSTKRTCICVKEGQAAMDYLSAVERAIAEAGSGSEVQR